MLILGLTEEVEKIFRNLMAVLCKLIYPLIRWMYELFINISKVNILDSKQTQPIYERVTMILTIIMVFYVTFEFVKFIVQPEGITNKEKGPGNIVIKMVIVVILIAFVPRIFDGAIKLQNIIVDKGIINQIILGPTGNVDKNFGGSFSSQVFSMFYRVNDEFVEAHCGLAIPCTTIVEANIKDLKENGKLSNLTLGLNKTGKKTKQYSDGSSQTVEEEMIEFDGLLAVIVGCIIIYVLALYCIDVGVRWAQMIYLQIIAPIPIIGYLSPKKDGIFQKWCKQCLTTYLDIFLRIAIIYLALFICNLLLESRSDIGNNLLSELGEISTTMETFIYIALILGVMLFAQKAPKMLQELFPQSSKASGNFGLKSSERVAPMAARAIGAGLGATRFLGGAISRGVATHKRNKAEREKTGQTRQQQKEAHQQNRAALREQKHHYKNALRNRNDVFKSGTATANAKKTAQEQLDTARKNLEGARSQVADDKNKKYRSVAFNTIAGGVGGAYRGIKTGAGATKLQDIPKKVAEGKKVDREAIAAREKWLDSGGGSEVSRFVSKLEKNAGIPTTAQRTNAQIKRYEDEIKAEEAYAKREEAALSTASKATDTNTNKVRNGKLKNETQFDLSNADQLEEANSLARDLGYVDGADMYNKLGKNAGEKFTLVDLYNLAKGDLDSKKAQADKAAQDAQADPSNATKQLVAQRAQAAAQQARVQEEKTAKKLGEFAMQQILSQDHVTRRSNDKFDQDAVTNLEQTLQTFKEVIRYPATKDALEEYYNRMPERTPDEIAKKAKMRNAIDDPNSITDFGTFDLLSKWLSSIAGDRRTGKISQLQDLKNILSTSSATDAAKANDDMSGKK